MLTQGQITVSGIDGAFARHHHVGVLPKFELLKAIESRGHSKAAMARALGLPASRVSEMFIGKRDLSYEEARILAASFGMSGTDLERPAATLEEVAAENGIVLIEEIDLALGMGGGMYADIATSRGLVPFKRDWLNGIVKGKHASLRVVRGEGDSMQPTILDGDIVLVDMSQQAILSQDRIWAVFWGDLGMIKRVRRQPSGSYQLMSDNPAIHPIDAVDGEMHVMGRVVWIGRRM